MNENPIDDQAHHEKMLEGMNAILQKVDKLGFYDKTEFEQIQVNLSRIYEAIKIMQADINTLKSRK